MIREWIQMLKPKTSKLNPVACESYVYCVVYMLYNPILW